jgi:hypothetical protein
MICCGVTAYWHALESCILQNVPAFTCSFAAGASAAMAVHANSIEKVTAIVFLWLCIAM